MTDLVRIPVRNTELVAVERDGKPYVSLRHACEALGIDPDSQRRRLARTPWASTVVMTVRVGDQRQHYDLTMIDRKTFTGWLMTIDTGRVREEARPAIELFQREAVDALDAYFHDGGAINPRATEEQAERLIYRSKALIELLTATKGLVPDAWLTAKVQVVASRALGETPEIAHEDMPLYVEDFLKERISKRSTIKSLRGPFGTVVAMRYRDVHGRPPVKAPGEVDGRVRAINTYTEADRALMEEVWDEKYAHRFSAPLQLVAGED